MDEGNLAVIPARGGSKRVPRKNIRVFLGKPLIVHTIEAAVGSGVFARVIVSTDDPEIRDVALAAGADVPFLRDAGLADDHSPSSLVTLDALERAEANGDRFLGICQLMPNCPLRDAADIAVSAAAFRQCAAPAQLSVTGFGWMNPWWAMQKAEGNRLSPVFAEEIKSRSQDLPGLVCPSGAIWWARPEVLRAEKTFYAAGYVGCELPWWHGVDIDTEEDWVFAEVLARASLPI